VWASILISNIILAQAGVPIDFNGLATYGPLGFFVLYQIWLKWKDDEKYINLLNEHNKYMAEDRKDIQNELERSRRNNERIEKYLDK
jgi:hypothetical protein